MSTWTCGGCKAEGNRHHWKWCWQCKRDDVEKTFVPRKSLGDDGPSGKRSRSRNRKGGGQEDEGKRNDEGDDEADAEIKTLEADLAGIKALAAYPNNATMQEAALLLQTDLDLAKKKRVESLPFNIRLVRARTRVHRCEEALEKDRKLLGEKEEKLKSAQQEVEDARARCDRAKLKLAE